MLFKLSLEGALGFPGLLGLEAEGSGQPTTLLAPEAMFTPLVFLWPLRVPWESGLQRLGGKEARVWGGHVVVNSPTCLGTECSASYPTTDELLQVNACIPGNGDRAPRFLHCQRAGLKRTGTQVGVGTGVQSTWSGD